MFLYFYFYFLTLEPILIKKIGVHVAPYDLIKITKFL